MISFLIELRASREHLVMLGALRPISNALTDVELDGVRSPWHHAYRRPARRVCVCWYPTIVNHGVLPPAVLQWHRSPGQDDRAEYGAHSHRRRSVCSWSTARPAHAAAAPWFAHIP